MRIERLAVRLRARSGWEAVELGMALVRRHAGAVWKPWLAVTLPVFLLLNAGAWALDRFWLAALLMWWLKPVFDRIPLYVISRAVFGSVPGTRETLRAQATWGACTMLHLLTWRRFSPVRALYLPIDLLEGVQGQRLRQRRSVLGGQAYGNATLLMLACLHFEGALVLGGMAAVALYLPESLLPDNMQAALRMLSIEWPAWLEFAWNALVWAAVSVVEPFYVGAGFGLYLNRRTQVEAWDVEIVFRKLRARLSAATPLVLALVLLAGLAPPLRAQDRHDGGAAEQAEAAPERATPPTLPEVFGEQRVDDAAFRRAAERAYRDPALGRTQTRTTWEWRKPEDRKKESHGMPAWLAGLGGVLAFIGEWGLWILAGILVLVLLAAARYWLPWMRGGAAGPRALRPSPAQSAALVLPEALPDDIAAAARRLWAEGRPRDALALLYRASVEAMAAHADIVLPPGATEAECLRASRRLPQAEERSLFARVVRTWQYAAYAQRLPAAEDFDALVGELQRRYGWAA